MKLSKLCLGTAQLGMDYGINNLAGKPNFQEVEKIIRTAIDGGINAFDTSPDYGNSEEVLGKCLKDCDRSKLIFISKVLPVKWSDKSKKIIEDLHGSISLTLSNLGISQIPIYLFHRFGDMQRDNGIILKELLAVQKKGVIGKLGISTYTPEEAEKSLNIRGIEVIQIPFNLIDKRLMDNGSLKKAKEKGVIVLARSVFLQGLFFMEKLPKDLQGFSPYQKKKDDICRQNDLSIEELALRYALSINEISSVLIGVDNAAQLQKNIAIARKVPLSKDIISKIEQLGSAPEKIINPRLWREAS